jgi:peptide/nickel transport system ATP-binding protein
MYLGRIVEVAAARSSSPRRGIPYTRLLLDAIPDLELTGKARTPVAGEVPSPLDPPPGCAFHPRCPLADDRCRREVPLLKSVPGTSGAGEGGEVACHAVEEGRDGRAAKGGGEGRGVASVRAG